VVIFDSRGNGHNFGVINILDNDIFLFILDIIENEYFKIFFSIELPVRDYKGKGLELASVFLLDLEFSLFFLSDSVKEGLFIFSRVCLILFSSDFSSFSGR